MTFDPPAYVVCLSSGLKMVEGMTSKACQLRHPDRWVLIGPNPEAVVTVVGGTCTTVLDKIQ